MWTISGSVEPKYFQPKARKVSLILNATTINTDVPKEEVYLCLLKYVDGLK